MEVMASSVEEITKENAYLHKELRKNLEGQMMSTQSCSSQLKFSKGDGVVDSLQQQLEMVMKERDNFRNMLKKTSQELEITQRTEQVCIIRKRTN